MSMKERLAKFKELKEQDKKVSGKVDIKEEGAVLAGLILFLKSIRDGIALAKMQQEENEKEQIFEEAEKTLNREEAKKMLEDGEADKYLAAISDESKRLIEKATEHLEGEEKEITQVQLGYTLYKEEIGQYQTIEVQDFTKPIEEQAEGETITDDSEKELYERMYDEAMAQQNRLDREEGMRDVYEPPQESEGAKLS